MNEAVNNLCNYILTLDYGSIITTDVIENITGISKEKEASRYRTVIRKTKKQLLNNNNKVITSVSGTGYRLITPDEFTDFSLGFYKRGMSTMAKGANHLQHAPMSEMSNEAKDIYRKVTDRAIILDAAMKGARTELKELSKKKHPFLEVI